MLKYLVDHILINFNNKANIFDCSKNIETCYKIFAYNELC